MLWDNPANAAYFHRRGKKIQLKSFFTMGKDNQFKRNAIDWLDLCLKEIILPFKFNTVDWFDS